jgi:hypothetical protein
MKPNANNPEPNIIDKVPGSGMPPVTTTWPSSPVITILVPVGVKGLKTWLMFSPVKVDARLICALDT